MPMRPMGSPWKYAIDKFYNYAKSHPGWLTSLPDDYWVSESVLERLQEIVDADEGVEWQSSVRRKPDFIRTKTYEALQ